MSRLTAKTARSIVVFWFTSMLTGFVFLVPSTLLNASIPSVRLDPRACRPLPPAQRNWLGKDWLPFQNFVKSCEVTRGKATVLYVISIWVDEYYASLPPSLPAVKFPRPIVAGPDGKVLGSLPMNFPRDPPRTLDVTFVRWSDNFPQQIQFWVEDPTVLGNHSVPPIDWDAKRGRFLRRNTKKEEYGQPSR